MRMLNRVNNPRRLVFADEKQMKEIDIYGRVRRNVIDGTVPHIPCNPNIKNRHCILAAVKLLRVTSLKFDLPRRLQNSWFVIWPRGKKAKQMVLSRPSSPSPVSGAGRSV